MSKLILISGPPGAGKTYLAKYLSENLQLPSFSKDFFKESLFDSLGWKDAEWSKKLGVAAMKLLYLTIDIELKNNRTIIAEANFRPEYDQEHIQEISQLYNCEILELHLTADKKILRERFDSRFKNKERHSGHADETTSGDYFYESPENPIGIGMVFNIQTDDYSKVDYLAILKKVTIFIE